MLASFVQPWTSKVFPPKCSTLLSISPPVSLILNFLAMLTDLLIRNYFYSLAWLAFIFTKEEKCLIFFVFSPSLFATESTVAINYLHL